LSEDGRNLLCGSVDWDRFEAAFGSADHAAYVMNMRTRKIRRLFTKTAGHREWVAAVTHLPDGRIASGGLDARLCVWSAGGVACQELAGHAAPVSQLAAVPAAGGATFVSASYDKRLVAWRAAAAAGRVQQQQVLLGHRAPVLQLGVAGSCAASGDRDGSLQHWDLAAGAAVGTLVHAHKGHCTALQWWTQHACQGLQGGSAGGQPLLLSGGQDGCLRVWDLRTRHKVAHCAAHAEAGGTGAVGSIAVAQNGCIVTAGADCSTKGLDPRLNLKAAWSRKLSDFPYSMAVHGDTVFIGCGDGSIAMGSCSGCDAWHNVSASSCAVRTLHASHDLLVAGCDDGSAVLLSRAAGQSVISHGM
jgi:F-box/WD-40 domain protein 7